MDSASELSSFMPTPVGASSSSSALEKRETPLDLSHHLSALALARTVSPLKGQMKYYGIPGMISLGGGVPHPSVFPFNTLSAEILPSNAYKTQAPSLVSRSAATTLSWLRSFFAGDGALEVKPIDIKIGKYASAGGGPDEVLLKSALQYGNATGLPALSAFISHFVKEVYQPYQPDTVTLLHAGSTDAWVKIVDLLCEKGQGVLVEEWTYASAMNAWLPLGCVPVPIKMDSIGLLPEDLEETLSSWDAEARGRPRPHVMYLVSTGQNPTGALMSPERKKALYDICSRWDVIICEDEPYWALQMPPYVPLTSGSRPEIQEDKEASTPKEVARQTQEFIDTLAPSFLKYDRDGRVIRIDTFSKTIAPGSRMGFWTCSPMFGERLQRASESSTQGASGFSQALITKLFQTWGYDGYVRWLRGIRATYTMRRDWTIDAFEKSFHLEHAQLIDLVGGTRGVVCYERNSSKTTTSGEYLSEKSSGKGRALVSFVPPDAGMFVWLQVNISLHPSYQTLRAAGVDEPELTLMEQLWIELAENKVLLSPGTYFSPYDKKGGPATPEARRPYGYFRLAFSMASKEEMEKAIEIFARVLVDFFKPTNSRTAHLF